MPVAWFVVPYVESQVRGRTERRCAIDDHTAAIAAEQGAWRELELRGDRALVEVAASTEILQQLAAAFEHLPDPPFDGTLAEVPAADRSRLAEQVADAIDGTVA